MRLELYSAMPPPLSYSLLLLLLLLRCYLTALTCGAC